MSQRPTRVPRTTHMLIGLVSEGMKARDMSSAELARLTGLSAPYISQVLSAERAGSPGTWDMLLDAVKSDYAGHMAYPIVNRQRKRIDAKTQWQKDKSVAADSRRGEVTQAEIEQAAEEMGVPAPAPEEPVDSDDQSMSRAQAIAAKLNAKAAQPITHVPAFESDEQEWNGL